MKKLFIIIGIILNIFFVNIYFQDVYAICTPEDIEDGVPCSNTGFTAPDQKLVSEDINEPDFRTQVLKIINYFLTFLGLVAVIAIIYAGVIMILDLGGSENIDKAKNILQWSGGGIIIILLAYSYVTWILGSGKYVDGEEETFCGDGKLQSYEECEKGENYSCENLGYVGKTCNINTCKCESSLTYIKTCGDGKLQSYEECEQGEEYSCKRLGYFGKTCNTNTCKCVSSLEYVQTCGDGKLQSYEECEKEEEYSCENLGYHEKTCNVNTCKCETEFIDKETKSNDIDSTDDDTTSIVDEIEENIEQIGKLDDELATLLAKIEQNNDTINDLKNIYEELPQWLQENIPGQISLNEIKQLLKEQSLLTSNQID